MRHWDVKGPSVRPMLFASVLLVSSLPMILAACQGLGIASAGRPAPDAAAVDAAAGDAWKAFCAIAKPISFDDSPGHDTPGTVVQIRGHNQLGIEHCGW
jgi:hypothetical protein